MKFTNTDKLRYYIIFWQTIIDGRDISCDHLILYIFSVPILVVYFKSDTYQ